MLYLYLQIAISYCVLFCRPIGDAVLQEPMKE